MDSERVGRVAFVRYRGGAVGDDQIDDCSQGEPVRVVLGVGELPKGMDNEFISMEIGEERTVRIPYDLGFGAHDPNGVQTYPRTYIVNGEKLKEGDIFAWTNPVSGSPIPVKVIHADDLQVTIDFNHPFAGKDLIYWLQLVSMD